MWEGKINMKLKIYAVGLTILMVFVFMAPRWISAQTTGTVDYGPKILKKLGWDKTPVASYILQGKLAQYDSDGNKTHEYDLQLYRKSSTQLRYELSQGGKTTVYGIDQSEAWKTGSVPATADEIQGVHDWLRLWPDWLFQMRGLGKDLHQTKHEAINVIPAEPGGNPAFLKTPQDWLQLEVQDVIGPLAVSADQDPYERRMLSYGIDTASNLISSVRWFEPFVAGQDLNDPQTQIVLVEVYFSDYRSSGGVLWPFKILHMPGYKVDYMIQLSNFQLNPSIDDQMFKQPQ
jgi:hypothetical protein